MNFKRLEPVEWNFLGYDDPSDKVSQDKAFKELEEHLSKGVPDLIVTKISRTVTKINTHTEGKNCRVYTVVGYKTNNPKAGR